MAAARDEARDWVRAKGLEPGKELQWLSDISNKYIWKGERGNYDANVLQLSVACSRASDGGEEGEGEEGAETGKGEFALDVEAALIEIFSLAWIKTTFMPAKSDGGEIGGEDEGEGEGSDRESVQEAIVRAIKRCEEGGVIQRESLLVYMEKDLLAKCGYVKSAQQLFVKERKINTKLNFKQNKYNLLGEESEGYAKCIIALNTYGAAPGGAQADLRRHIESLIGRFSLDPNRVLEVILGILEEFPSAENLWDLIPIFNTEALVHILGFKFQGYHTAKALADEEAREEGEVPTAPGAANVASGGAATNAPSALYALVGNLMRRDLVTCEALLGHLSPPNQAVREAHERARDLVTKDVDAIGKISLNSKDPKAKQHKQGQGASVLNARRMALDASEMYDQVVSQKIDGYSFHGQRMRLCIAALESQNWDLALILLDYWKGIGVLPATDRSIAEAMCTAVSVLLEPAWSCLFPQGMVRSFAKETITSEDLSTGEKVEKIFLSRHAKVLLTHLGENLCTNPKLLTKVCRYLGGALVVLRDRDQQLGHKGAKDKGSYASMEMYAMDIMEVAILPALCLIPSNPAITMEVWHVLDLVPYTARFLLYGKWQQKIREAPLLRAASKMAHVEVRRILRRVTTASSLGSSSKEQHTAVSLKDLTKALSGEGADKQSDLVSATQRERDEEKEKKVQLGRMLAKCCHACPLACLEVIVKQVESYGEKMALPIVDSLCFLTPFGLDVLTFIILCRLASASKEKFKEDGVNIADWVEALAVFVGLLCKNYYNKGVCLAALCQYVANQLKVNEVVDLVVIRQMVTHAAGIDHVGDISDNQVEMLAGGDMLQISGMLKSDQTPQMRRASAALRTCLNLARDARHPNKEEGDGDLGIPLLILMAQQHNALMFTLLNPPLKLMGSLIDRSQASFLQYSSFLQEEITGCSARYSGGVLIGCQPADVAKYADLLPKMSEMASLYKLEPEYVFHVHRPVMRYLFLQSHEDILKEAGEVDMDPEGDRQVVKEGNESGSLPGWAALLEEIGDKIRTPKGLNMDLYATFWSLRLGDLFFPKQRYADAQETLQAQVKQIDKAVAKMDRDIGSAREHKLYIEGDLARSTRSRGNRQARDNKNSRESRTWEKKLKELNDLEDELVQMQKQREDLGQIKARAKMMVNKTKAEMLSCAQQAQDANKCLNDAMDNRWRSPDFDMAAFFHHCILPRMRLSESDALFCGVFLNDFASKLCSSEAPKGRSECWAFVRSEISKLIGLLTAAEAVRLGIFLSCSVSPPGPPGGGQSQGLPNPPSASTSGSLWPLLINKLEEEEEYMTRKNAMVVLRRCVGKGLAQEETFVAAKTKLLGVLAKIAEAAVEEDLKQMAKSLTGFIVGKVKKAASTNKLSAPRPGPQPKAKVPRPTDLSSPREASRVAGGRGRGDARRLDARSPPFVPSSHLQGKDRRVNRGNRDERERDRRGGGGGTQDRDHHTRENGRSRTDRQERQGRGGGTYSHPNSAARAGDFGKAKTPDGRGDRDRDRDSDRGIKRRASDEGWHNKRRRYSDGPHERDRGPRSPLQGSQPREGGHQGDPTRVNPRSARAEWQVDRQEDRPSKMRDHPPERERERERKHTDPKTQGGPTGDKDKNKNAPGGGGPPTRSARGDRGGPNAPQAKPPRKPPLPDQGEEFNKSERHRGHSAKRRRTSEGLTSGRDRSEGRHSAGNGGNRRPDEHERRRKKHRKH